MDSRIKYLVMDVDGTLTDGKIYIGNSGEVFKAFNIKDGYGISEILIPHGIVPVIITGRKSEILENRCTELGIENLYQGVKDKLLMLDTYLNKNTGEYCNVAYIGDDLNDLSCMKMIKGHGGLVGCPADAANKVRELADYVAGSNGGNGAVREFIDWLTE